MFQNDFGPSHPSPEVIARGAMSSAAEQSIRTACATAPVTVEAYGQRSLTEAWKKRGRDVRGVDMEHKPSSGA